MDDLTDNDVMVIVIDYMLTQFKPDTVFYNQLKDIRDGIKGKKHIEEADAPRYKSILFWSTNIFSYTMKEYREMAKWIKENIK